jgi:predicted regulator of Ras-like GTPase activity (Roadblock/LC7/MglB family)
MLSKISNILEPLTEDEGVKMVVLYRIDGVPIFARLNVPKREIAPTLYWLEKQIKDMLYQIFSQNLDEASFKFGNTKIMLYPVSRTIILGIMADEETSAYKLDIDIRTSCKEMESLITGN